MTRSDSVVVVERTLGFTPDAVFEAFASAESMSRWLCAWPGRPSEVTSDFRVGGTFTIVMLGPGGERVHHHGEYREIVPPRKLVFTWSSPAVENSLVHVELAGVPDGCKITLRHELLPQEWKDRHESGWGTVLANLAEALGEQA